MKRKVAIFIVRTIGTLAGVLGALMLYSASRIALDRSEPNLSIMFNVVFSGINLLIGLFCLWIAYLVWFRFSPRAIRQTCGLLGFILIGVVMARYPAPHHEPGSIALIYLGTIALALMGYRLLSWYLNGVVFGDRSTPPAAPSST
jgi:hypothetical protein